jgi:diguanylate cyclase
MGEHMNKTGKIIGISGGVLISIFLYFIFTYSQNSLIHMIVASLIIIGAWIAGNYFDKVKIEVQELKVRMKEMKSKYNYLENKYNEQENKYSDLESANKQLNKHIQEIALDADTYRTIIDQSKDVIVIFEVKNGYPSNFLFVNQMACEVLGYSYQELLALTPQDITPQDRLEELPSIMDKVFNEGHARFDGLYTAKNGQQLPYEFNFGLTKLGGKEIIISIDRDITERKELEEKLTEMAYYDKLTGLANRKMLEVLFTKSLKRVYRAQHNLAVLFIDLDGFKNINDTMGHDAGDQLLKEIAERLTNIVRDDDIVSRLGGDEFIIVIEDVNEENLSIVAERIIEEVSIPCMIHEQEAKVSPSIGISLYPFHGDDQRTLIQNADKAMYFAKSNGKNNYQFYTEDLAEFIPPKSNVLERFLNLFQK